MPSKVESEKDVMLEINLIRNCEEFSYIFSSHLCFNENVDHEVVVVGEIAKKHQKITEGQETDKDDTTEHEGPRVQRLFLSCYSNI
jgi:hypothetical protein